MSIEWETVIGLEIHAQLATKTKIFSGSPTAYGAEPNTQADLVDLGYPGVLPVLNGAAVRMAAQFGLAVGAKIARRSVFARKNYFYPDLPKGYQISQYELPIVAGGHLDVMQEDGSVRRVGITRAHLEEDAGKSLHEGHAGVTAIDLNRAGTPLIEIVSEPDMRSAKEAIAYMKKVHTLVRYLGICDGNMQEGSFRCDANVSVRHKGSAQFGTRAELKNLNSFRYVEKAINIEVERQIAILESGGTVKQETRLYDSDRDETRSMRSKEEANDYRYFPDPDLLPVMLDEAFIEGLRQGLPELPDQKAARFESQYGLSAYDAQLLTAASEMADFYEQVAKLVPGEPKLAANWVMGDFSAALNKEGLDISGSRLSATQLGGLLQRIADDTISGKIAKEVFEVMWADGSDADAVIEARGLKQITDGGAIEKVIDEIMAANPRQLADFRSGKDKLFGFFVGQAMKATGGKANPALLNDLLKKKLAPVNDSDQLRRFLFEDAPLRGHWVHIEDAWREAREHQQLPPAVRELLGEALAATVLLAGSLKFDGTLTLQLQGGNGLVPMLVAQATSELTLRGVAHVDPQALEAGTADDAEFTALVGDGQLVISVEQGEGASPWQGIVPLVGNSLSACLEQYFEASEQVATCVVLAASDFSAAGLLLQKLPTPGGPGEAEEAQVRDLWEEAAGLLATVDREELLAREPDDLLARLFPSHDLRLFEGSPVSFACRCGRERVATMLQSLGRAEIDSILEEQGTVTVTCEFCQRPYTFDAVDAGQLFLEVPAAQPPNSVN